MITDISGNGFQPNTSVRASGNSAPAVVSSSVPAAASEQSDAKTAPDPAKLQEAVSKLNDYVQNIQRTLAFSVDKDTGRTIVKVYDSETNELIRQIPPEETVKLAQSIEQQTATLFVKERA
jgi:flagellar protein FlaG